MRLSAGVSLCGTGLDGLAHPLSPELLHASHPLWAADVLRYGPWEEQGGWYRSRMLSDGPPLCICGECGSALDVARELVARDALPQWGAVLAVSQSAGRGQMRRRWVSGPGNLLAAWRWPSPPAPWDPLLPLLVGEVVADELAAHGVEVRIKWPNDLLVNGRKIGGILVEERGGTVLVGLGLNLVDAPSDDALRVDSALLAGFLGDCGGIKSIISLWRSLVNRADNWYRSKVSGSSPAQFLDSFTLRLAWIGQMVRVCGAKGDFAALLLGLAPDGGLVLERDGRREILYSGSISLL